MQGVKEAILLLKQYGTPVFASAVTAAKFTAWAGIVSGTLGVILSFVLLWWLLPKLKDVEADKEKEIKAEDNFGSRLGGWAFFISCALVALAFAIGGVYELVSLDYQAYKLMLFK